MSVKTWDESEDGEEDDDIKEPNTKQKTSPLPTVSEYSDTLSQQAPLPCPWLLLRAPAQCTQFTVHLFSGFCFLATVSPFVSIGRKTGSFDSFYKTFLGSQYLVDKHKLIPKDPFLSSYCSYHSPCPPSLWLCLNGLGIRFKQLWRKTLILLR